MSGVYIKGMAMPTDCIHCRFRGFGGIQNEKVVCSFTGRNAFINTVERFDDCPLVPVPDHGRLIDADALKENWFLTELGNKVIEVQEIDAAPTIIPASGGKENE